MGGDHDVILENSDLELIIECIETELDEHGYRGKEFSHPYIEVLRKIIDARNEYSPDVDSRYIHMAEQ